MSVRVEFYDVGPYSGGPALRTRGQHWDPDVDEHDPDYMVEVEPGVMAPADSDDEIPGEVALTFSGDEVGVLVGSRDAMRRWVRQAKEALDAYDQQVGEALAAEPCRTPAAADGTPGQVIGDGTHAWTLTEEGYDRTWATEVITGPDGAPTRIEATFSGSADWTEDGEGPQYVACDRCPARLPVPEGLDVDYD